MASREPHRSFGTDFRRHFVAGLFVLMPVMFTVWVLRYLFDTLSDLGQPIVAGMIRSMALAPADTYRIQRILEFFKDALSFGVVTQQLVQTDRFIVRNKPGAESLGEFDDFLLGFRVHVAASWASVASMQPRRASRIRCRDLYRASADSPRLWANSRIVAPDW